MSGADRFRQAGNPAAWIGLRGLRAAGLGALAGVISAVVVAHGGAPVAAASAAAAHGTPAGRGAQGARVDQLVDLGDWTAVDHPARILAAAVASPSTPPVAGPVESVLAPVAQPAQAAAQHGTAVMAGASHAPAAAAPPAPPAAAPSGAAAQVIALVNQDRAAAGLPALRVSAALDRAAAVHAGQNASADRMSHDGLTQDVNAQGVSWRSLGECLGFVSGSPNSAYINQMWMQSSAHRPIILGSFTTVGAGWAQSASGQWYVSLIVIS